MTTQWIPTEVLQLDPDCLGFTCIGYAKTQGRRCRNPIAYANRKEAASILQEMSGLNPQCRRMDFELEELASRLLCRRWHQDQADVIKTQWHRRIETHQAAETTRRTRVIQRAPAPTSARSSEPRTRAASLGRDRIVTTVTPLSARGSSVPASPSTVTGDETRERRSHEPNTEEPRQQPEAAPDSSTQQEASTQRTTNHRSESSSPPSSPSERTAHPLATAAPDHSTAAREEVEIVIEANMSLRVHLVFTQERPSHHEDSSHPTHQHPAHPERRAIEDDCPICCEDLSDGGDTTWCRAQCGHNFHADCMGLWHASQLVDGRVKTCPYWYVISGL